MRYKHDKEQLEKVVKANLSIAQVCKELNIKPCGGNYKTLKNKFKMWNIDTSHFTGAAWNQGERFVYFGKKYKLIDVLVENSPYKSTNNLKGRLYKEGLKERKCEECGQGELWNGEKLVFELEHVNGINDDNRIENLKILCPNCHSQTSTFRGRKLKKNKIKIERVRKEAKKHYCPQCEKEFSGRGKVCTTCTKINRRKTERPPYLQLIKEIENSSYVAVGRNYGVSDNTIRKWIKNYEKELN